MPILLGFLLGGLVFAGVGLWLCLKTQALLARGQVTEGRYVDAIWDSSDLDAQHSQYGVIEFQTAQGQTVRFRARLGTLWQARNIGKPVQVLYDPATPAGAVVHSFIELWLPGLIFLILGIAWALIAGVLLVVWQG